MNNRILEVELTAEMLDACDWRGSRVFGCILFRGISVLARVGISVPVGVVKGEPGSAGRPVIARLMPDAKSVQAAYDGGDWEELRSSLPCTVHIEILPRCKKYFILEPDRIVEVKSDRPRAEIEVVKQ